ncbi:MAG: cation:proton antiporter [Acidimicrobiia bacterium]|nr:cation:proton antiporter [Acidimicrobiia bacterium]
MILATAPDELGRVLVELGTVVFSLAVLARLADAVGFSPVPFYLLAGLAFGEGGIAPLDVSTQFIEIGAEIGVVLLLLALGLEYTAEELRSGLRTGLPTGIFDAVANFTPGFAAGLLLGWSATAAALLGGVTYISSSGVVAKVLADLQRLGNRETPVVLSTLVTEDLAMAVYLPVVGVLLAGDDVGSAALSLSLALGAVAVILTVALRHGHHVTRMLATESDEGVLLGVLGLTLVVAGLAQRLQVSAAVGAFLVGIAVSGPVQARASLLLAPLRDLFAATFFVFFGLRIDPGDLPSAAVAAVALGVVTGATKVLTGSWAARRAGIGPRGRWRAGTSLVARGEFSIVIAELGVVAAVEPDLGPTVAAYVLLLAVAGPVLTRYADHFARPTPPRRPGLGGPPARAGP